jgi:hypothetical protein
VARPLTNSALAARPLANSGDGRLC